MPEDVLLENPYNVSLVDVDQGRAGLLATDPVLSLQPARQNTAIIGFNVNATSMVRMLPHQACCHLVEQVHNFVVIALCYGVSSLSSDIRCPSQSLSIYICIPRAHHALQQLRGSSDNPAPQNSVK